MKVLCHPDPRILERELVRRIESVHPADGRPGTLVLVPTRRLGAHIERRLAAAGPRRAWLGLRVSTFRAVSRAILDHARVEAPTVVSERLRLALVGRVLEAQPDRTWSRFVRERPSFAARVAGALQDLREAGVDPASLDAEELAPLYAAYAGALDDAGDRGFTDETGLVRRALPRAQEFASAHGAVFLHGAYELLGIHVDLLRALDRGREVTMLAPVRPGASVTAYAERFARGFLAPTPDLEQIVDDDPGSGLALDALYDEERRPEAPPRERILFRTCQGAAAEIETAVRRSLEAIAGGVPPEEIAIIGRSLSPYAGAIEELLAEGELPFTSSVATPLRRRPFVRDLLVLLRVVERDFPRAMTVDLLRSPRLAWDAIAPRDRPSGERADAWSRKARIVGGLEEWTVDLPRWVEEDDARRARYRPDDADDGWRVDEARRIARALAVLRARVAPAPRTFAEHSRRFSVLLDRALVPQARAQDRSARLLLEEALADMARLETWLGDARRVSFGEAVDWLERAIDATSHEAHEEDRGGIRVLDAIPARGLTFEHVHLVGMNAGDFPRRAVDDPVLPDALRRRLREATGRPLPIAAERLDEEKLLLSLLLGASRVSAEVSWQRAAEAGRVRSPSLALRELARIARGHPDLGALAPTDVPSHPEQWLRYLIEHELGLVAGEELLLLALAGQGPSAHAALARAEPALADGLRTLAATETFDIVDPAFDARLGRPTVPESGVTVSSLETLGQCPLRYFFGRVLRVREPDDEIDALELEPRELGSEVHARLATLYRTLADDGLLVTERIDEARARAAAMLDRDRRTILGDLGRRLAHHFPVLWNRIADTWHDSLAGFVDRDLRRIAAASLALEGVEVAREDELPIGDALLRIRGRFDRVLRSPRETVVSDYKTGRSTKRLAERVNPTRMLKGLALQVPLYRLLAGPGVSVELLGIGPSFAADPDAERAPFDGFASPEIGQGFLDTMCVLLDLLGRGSFPLWRDGEVCQRCPYARACRFGHPPTQVREAADPDGARLAAVRRKNASRPGRAGAGDDA